MCRNSTKVEGSKVSVLKKVSFKENCVSEIQKLDYVENNMAKPVQNANISLDVEDNLAKTV